MQLLLAAVKYRRQNVAIAVNSFVLGVVQRIRRSLSLVQRLWQFVRSISAVAQNYVVQPTSWLLVKVDLEAKSLHRKLCGSLASVSLYSGLPSLANSAKHDSRMGSRGSLDFGPWCTCNGHSACEAYLLQIAAVLQVGSIGINLGTVRMSQHAICPVQSTTYIRRSHTCLQNCMKLGYMKREALELGSDKAIWYIGHRPLHDLDIFNVWYEDSSILQAILAMAGRHDAVCDWKHCKFCCSRSVLASVFCSACIFLC